MAAIDKVRIIVVGDSGVFRLLERFEDNEVCDANKFPINFFLP